ncbi:MAG: type II toxin-antitoxin system RelE/ParE family toxin [Christensenellaceae bacterium]
MTKQYKVIVSECSKEMLAQHIKFLADYDMDAARKVKVKLIEAFSSLKAMPNRYPFFEEEFIPPNKYHKMFVENWYLVLFQIKDNIVYIDYVLDCRQDYSWLMR